MQRRDRSEYVKNLLIRQKDKKKPQGRRAGKPKIKPADRRVLR